MESLLETALLWTDAGYKVIPISSDSVPLVRGHFNHREKYTSSDVEAWCKSFPSAHLAMVCGYEDIIAIDCDVERPALSRRIMSFILHECGRRRVTIRERSGSERFAIICRADESLKKYSYGHSRIYITDKDVKQNIEYLGDNRLLTIQGTHRKQTFSQYQVNSVTPVNQLVRIGKDFLVSLFELFESYRLPKWIQIEKSKFVQKRREEALERMEIENTAKNWWETQHIRPINLGMDDATIKRKPLTQEELKLLLESIDGSQRENWKNVGICFYNFYEGSGEGLEKWTEWSRQFKGFKGKRDQYYHWTSFKKGYSHMTFEVLQGRYDKENNRGKGKWQHVVVTEKTEEITASQERFKAKHLSGEDDYNFMMDNYVLICEGDCVGDLSKSVGESVRPVKTMRSFLSSKKMIIEEPNQTGKIVKKKVSVFEQWYQNPEHKEAWGIQYLPGEKRIIPKGRFKETPNSVYYNKYCPPLVRRLKSKEKPSEKLRMFYKHMNYLFPNGGSTWMLNWMAQLVQEPEKRYRVSPLSISLYEGTGRGWLSELLSKLVGLNNYTTIRDILEIKRPGAKSGYLDGTVLAVVNETFVKGDERFSLVSKLKTILSDDLQEIDVKFGKHTYNQRVYTRFFFQSNHINGMKIDDGDTRIQPFINRSRPKDKKYYEELYACLEDDHFLNSVYDDLMSMEINHDILTHSQDTQDRRAVISASLSPTAHAFYEFRSLVGSKDFTDEMLDDFVTRHIRLTNPGKNVNVKELSFFKFSLQANTVVMFDIKVRNFEGLPTQWKDAKSLRASFHKTQAMLKGYLEGKDKDKGEKENEQDK